MKKKNISLSDLAQAAGVSKASVSVALQNRPGVSKATKSRIQRLARQLGYVPDPRIASIMATVRDASSKELLPIAWINSHHEKNAWLKYRFLSPYLEGAKVRALQSGYRIEEIWMKKPGLTVRQVSRRLYAQGIEGVIITEPVSHLHLRWENLAAVCIGGALLAPGLNRVLPDYRYNLLLALKNLKRLGYKRIGICLGDDVDRRSQGSCRASAFYFHSMETAKYRVPPLFYPWTADDEKFIGKKHAQKWMARCRPEVVVGHSNYLVRWAEELGLQVPKDMGVVHISTDDDVNDWAGIISNRRDMGAAAVDWVIGMAHERRFGVPDVPMTMTARGIWHNGWTLRSKLV